MPTTKIRTLGPGTLAIGESDSLKKFDADVTNTKLTPDTSTGDSIHFLDGHDETDEATTTFKLSGTIKEDYSAEGIQLWCFKHRGESLPFTFIPNNKAALKATGMVTIVPVEIGGDVKSKNDINFEFEATNVDMDATNPAA